MSVEVIDPTSAAGIASQALSQALATLAQVVAQATAAGNSATAAAASQAAIQALVSGLGIPYRWTGTVLQIKLPDGTYGPAVDLSGPQGEPGATPTFHVGQVTVGTPFVSISAVDPLNPIIDFTIAKGTPGTNGTNGTNGFNGWTPVFTVYSDGARRVLEVTGWTGGSGTSPAVGVYVSSSGFTSVLANAIDLRGAPGANGAGTGTVVPQGTITSGHAATFADNTGQNIKDGGPLIATSGSVTGGHQVVFADATGAVLSDGGAPLSTSGTPTGGHLVTYADSSGKVLQDGGAITPYGQSLIAGATAAAVKALLAITAADVSGGEATANKAQPNGYASLDSSGRLPSTQLPTIATGSMNYQGTWNASTNNPTLSSSTGTKGLVYKVSTAGSTTLDGNSQWFVGDLAVFDGATWDRISGGATSVHTVASLVGDITAVALKAALAITSSDVSGLVGYTQHGDSNYTILSSDLTVATSAVFTAPRTWTLPAASSVPAGSSRKITDAAGALSTTNTLTISTSGSDLVNGIASHSFGSTYSEIVLVSDGSSNWTYDVQGVARGGTGSSTQAGAFTNVVAPGGAMTGFLDFAPAVTIASAATIDIGGAASNVIDITGTTAITAFASHAAGALRFVRFTGSLVLTYNATSLILPGNATITTAAGDTATFRSLGSGNWVCTNYQGNTAASDVWAGTSGAKAVTPSSLFSAAAPVALTYASTVTPNLATFFNATLTLTGNCTLANPTGARAGQSGFIEIVQDSTGSRTMAFGTAYDFGTNGAPTLTTTASKTDIISYYVDNSATPRLICSILKGF